MVVKDVLKPVKKEITSYTVKNIVLWLAENNPQALFSERSLIYWVHKGLGELRTAIVTERLPYYMIPERNLMAAGGLKGEQKRAWESTITDMMKEGPELILRLPKKRQAVILHPEPMMWYSMKKVELEMLNLKFVHTTVQCDGKNVLNEIDPRIWIRMYVIIMEVRCRIYLECGRVNNLLEIYKMMLT
ncbi:hypothetical protein DPMN_038901 [Dreissena polymorpha]|uniref:Mab-21-like HhH/H2TH-like domain-containing protein n=2 Tax=Dreissena polymorpha TaxID=45954 RepID=A0A9D4ME12_DREPO|nr:hypothetical protein DPMN_038901 [Dreissena polymorpha]